MALIPQRLSAADRRLATAAGYKLPRATKSSFFGSMFSWVSTMRFSIPGYWPISGNAKPPINQATADSGQAVTPQTTLTISAAWSCVWITARTLASMPLELKRYDSTGRGTLMENDVLFQVLRWRPNSQMTAFNFWTCMWASVMLWGNGYAIKRLNGGRVIALDLLLPEFVTVYQTDAGAIRYRYDDPRKPADYSADEIFHLRERSLDGLVGASVIEYARNSIGLAQSGELAAAKTFKKGLNATGYIEVPKFLKKDQRDAFREEMETFSGDGDRAGGTMVLEGGTHFTQLSMKPLDAELLASRQFSVEDVCRWFGTPPILIGHASAGQTMWGSGIEQIFRGWLTLSLRPYITSATQAVSQSLIAPADRMTVYAEYDVDDLLVIDSQARAQLASSLTQNGLKTRNEVRRKEGDGDMEGGDVLTVQSNLIPLNELGSSGQGSGNQMQDAIAQMIRDELARQQAPPASQSNSA